MAEKEYITVTFILPDDTKKECQGLKDMTILDVAKDNDVDLEGACEGSLACSTCHVIVEPEFFYGKLEDITDEENDMLDLAHGLAETSRLGCQVKLEKGLDGLVVRLPRATRNIK